MGTYQSFADRKGASRSQAKLDAIRMPSSLDGKRVLDLGCNEGFFSLEAKRRGASTVIGIDRNRKHLPLARERAKAEGLDVDFREGNMLDLADGKFDLVLLLSAIYYLENPAEVLRRIRTKLTKNGILILELGVDRKIYQHSMVRALRSRDERCFPTESLLMDVWLQGYAVRRIGASVKQSGDPIPRYVYHCKRALTNVLLIGGKGGSGKSTLARQLSARAPVIPIDRLLRPQRANRATVHEMQALIDSEFKNDRSIRKMWSKLRDNDGVKKYLADAIAGAVKQSRYADTVIVEGYLVDDLAEQIRTSLGDQFRCWAVRPGV